jgi:serine phosphatase RsbU (regulator of sigma subunit)
MSFYEERQFALRSGDCLLLTTDGVTEAADGHDEESAANEWLNRRALRGV